MASFLWGCFNAIMLLAGSALAGGQLDDSNTAFLTFTAFVSWVHFFEYVIIFVCLWSLWLVWREDIKKYLNTPMKP
jgi:hypothetical protein